MFIKLLIVLTLLTGFAFPQLNFGVEGGLNFSTGSTIMGYQNTSIQQYAAGGFFEYMFAKSFFLVPGIRYSEKGVNFSPFNNPSGLPETKYTFNTIEIPVLLKYSYNAIPFRFSTFVGPYFGYIISAKRNEVAAGTTTKLGDFRKSDLGLTYGAGIGFELGNGLLEFQYKYSTQFSSEIDKATGFEIRNFNHFIGFAYILNISGEPAVYTLSSGLPRKF
ncbi:MAG: PorT family protein [Ignavibacteriaceae bacterium]|nr:PorT family protein [Ignavibacteriaceae bacterium]